MRGSIVMAARHRNESVAAPRSDRAPRRGGTARRRKGNGHAQLSRAELEQMLLGAARARVMRSRNQEEP
jgi:hypothetical protein